MRGLMFGRGAVLSLAVLSLAALTLALACGPKDEDPPAPAEPDLSDLEENSAEIIFNQVNDPLFTQPAVSRRMVPPSLFTPQVTGENGGAGGTAFLLHLPAATGQYPYHDLDFRLIGYVGSGTTLTTGHTIALQQTNEPTTTVTGNITVTVDNRRRWEDVLTSTRLVEHQAGRSAGVTTLTARETDGGELVMTIRFKVSQLQ